MLSNIIRRQKLWNNRVFCLEKFMRLQDKEKLDTEKSECNSRFRCWYKFQDEPGYENPAGAEREILQRRITTCYARFFWKTILNEFYMKLFYRRVTTFSGAQAFLRLFHNSELITRAHNCEPRLAVDRIYDLS